MATAPSPAQMAADLRAVVARRVGAGRRVAMLTPDPTLEQLLAGAGCELLVDPPSPGDLAGFRPDVVVLFDGALGQGSEGVRSLLEPAAAPEVVLSFANAASASSLLLALTGGTPRAGHGALDVEGWLAAAGYRVVERDLVVNPPPRVPLAADTEAALRSLFEQLEPHAAADRFVFSARRGPASVPALTPGLTSVVLAGGADPPAWEGSLAALFSQQQRPLEVVLPAGAAELVDRVKPPPGVMVVRLPPGAGTEDWALVSTRGAAAATGQYLGFFDAGDLPRPLHLSALVGRLTQGTEAWALSPARSLLGEPFQLGRWLARGEVARGRLLLDRTRLGRWVVAFPSGVAGAEAVFFARLAAVFRPAVVAGAPTVELNTPPAPRAGPLFPGRPLQLLGSLDELVAAPSLIHAMGQQLEGVFPGAGQRLERGLKEAASVLDELARRGREGR